MPRDVQYKKTGFSQLDKINIKIRLKNFILPNSSIVSVERIYSGNVNRNFKIITEQGDFFCKIAPLWYSHSLRREAWALKHLKRIGCYVPNVIRYFDADNKVIPGHEILILEYIDGVILAEIQRKNKFYKKIIDLYNNIHSVKLKRYGWLNKSFIGSNKAWKDFLLKIENEESIRKISDAWSKNVDFVQREINNFSYNIKSGRLLYGDFNYYNFIINQKNVLIAFDFQNCFSGDPLYDVGMILSKDIGFLKYLHHFSGFNPVNRENTRKIVFLYGLRHLLSMLSFYIDTDNKERILFINKRFLAIKKIYEKY